ncbi:restriction endonuclease subunit R, partial [bacterium]|nr:restriction endonuclease subunit R [bacterium]
MVNEKEIRRLVELFTHDLSYYRSPEYNEAAVRKEFISPFLEALGWDVQNRQSLQPNMREVLVEEGETSGIPDYALRIAGQTKLFIEAKRPAESLDNVKHIMQAKSYAWHSSSVFIVALTDFEEFKLYDATLEPDQHAPERGLIWSLRFDEYSDNLDKLAQLSRDEVEAGSLEKLLLRDKESKHLRTTVDEAFLKLLTKWREELAKSYKKHTPALDTYVLNEVVQRLLDRLVFIRICEDRSILSERSMEELVRYWRLEGKRRDLMRDHLAPFFHRQNRRFNGEILQPHPCEIYPLDSDLLANIVENLYFPESPYRFDWIGVEILGTIYERYLGKTLHVTAKRAKLEEKPEVRKAGGVYYTPTYIVDYIVRQTVGK